MGFNPSYFTEANGYPPDSRRPVEQVSWDDAMAYCAALTQLEHNAGRLPAGYSYRLPTDAEWEYACRAGSTNSFVYGAAMYSGMANFYGPWGYDSSVGSIFNASGVYFGRPISVGSYSPNSWGLHDVHGNVGEWCWDWWSPNLPGGSMTDPTGPKSGSLRVFRGGEWTYPAVLCRLGYRDAEKQGRRDDVGIGFRVVLARPLP